jgi:hypothetical protein
MYISACLLALESVPAFGVEREEEETRRLIASLLANQYVYRGLRRASDLELAGEVEVVPSLVGVLQRTFQCLSVSSCMN